MYASSVYALSAVNATSDTITAIIPSIAIFRFAERQLGQDRKAKTHASALLTIGLMLVDGQRDTHVYVGADAGVYYALPR